MVSLCVGAGVWQVEREEELLTNTLQKRLTAALREKVGRCTGRHGSLEDPSRRVYDASAPRPYMWRHHDQEC